MDNFRTRAPCMDFRTERVFEYARGRPAHQRRDTGEIWRKRGVRAGVGERGVGGPGPEPWADCPTLGGSDINGGQLFPPFSDATLCVLGLQELSGYSMPGPGRARPGLLVPGCRYRSTAVPAAQYLDVNNAEPLALTPSKSRLWSHLEQVELSRSCGPPSPDRNAAALHAAELRGAAAPAAGARHGPVRPEAQGPCLLRCPGARSDSAASRPAGRRSARRTFKLR